MDLFTDRANGKAGLQRKDGGYYRLVQDNCDFCGALCFIKRRLLGARLRGIKFACRKCKEKPGINDDLRAWTAYGTRGGVQADHTGVL